MHMIGILMFKFFFFIFLSLNMASANCIKDVFKVGAGFDSLVYNGERGPDELDIVSDSGVSLRAHWIIFCPSSGLEISPYIYMRNYTFSEFDDGGEVDDFNSFSIGSTLLKGFNFGDLFIDIYQREELGIGARGDDDLTDVKYDNLGVLGGYGFNYYKGARSRFDAKFAMGALFSSDDQFDTGFVAKVSTDFLYKISSKFSLIFDVYYELYKQENTKLDLDIRREEFGVNSSVLFRI